MPWAYPTMLNCRCGLVGWGYLATFAIFALKYHLILTPRKTQRPMLIITQLYIYTFL